MNGVNKYRALEEKPGKYQKDRRREKNFNRKLHFLTTLNALIEIAVAITIYRRLICHLIWTLSAIWKTFRQQGIYNYQRSCKPK